MLGAIASAALLVAGSLIAGHAVLLLCDRRDAGGYAGPVGLAVLLIASGLTAAVGAKGALIAVVLLAVAGVAVVLAVALGREVRGTVRSRLDIHASQRPRSPAAEAPPGASHLPSTVGAVAAALIAAAIAAIPFMASGHVGVLGVGLVNDDMASHLLLADWIDERFRPEPVLIDQGYPIGPHALVAGVATVTGASTVDTFAGLILALPALTALVAFALLRDLGAWTRIGVSALVAVPYLAAAYLAQEAFKEPMLALFLLGFALLLVGSDGPRRAVPLGVIAAGTVFVYSFPGLAWLVGTALVLGAIEMARGWRPGRATWLALAGGLGAVVLLVAPDIGRVLDFRDFRALDPDTANEGGLGNLRGHISPLEALGIWPTSEFRLSIAAASVPAVVFYACGLFALAAFALGLPRWVRRYGSAIPAALITAAVLYIAARAFGTVYTSAKALAIAAPLITLITLGGLLSTRRRSEARGSEGEDPEGTEARGNEGEGSGRPKSLSSKEGAGETRQSLRSRTARTLADMDVKPARTGLTRALRLVAAAFAVGALASTVLVLRQAPVAPEAHAKELEQIRPLVEGQKLLFLGRDNFILWELRGSKPFTAVRNFYNPHYVKPNTDLEAIFSKFDFDSVRAEDLDRFPYVLTTRAAYGSSPPPGYEAVKQTDTYVLWERGARVANRREPGEVDAAPGRRIDCASDERITGNAAVFARAPIVVPANEWTNATVDSGEIETVELRVPPGRWALSLQYDSTRPLTLAEPRDFSSAGTGFSFTLPGNLDYRGSTPFYPAGELQGGREYVLGASVEGPPFFGELLGASSVAHLGALALTPVPERDAPVAERPYPGDAVETVALDRSCGRYTDWFEPGPR